MPDSAAWVKQSFIVKSHAFVEMVKAPITFVCLVNCAVSATAGMP